LVIYFGPKPDRTENAQPYPRLLYVNGIVFHPPDTPPIHTFLESNSGSYTTTRTHDNTAFLLFCVRHLQRLSNSVKILLPSNPRFLSKSLNSTKIHVKLCVKNHVGAAYNSLFFKKLLPPSQIHDFNILYFLKKYYFFILSQFIQFFLFFLFLWNLFFNVFFLFTFCF
jgi:hypothetical protein